MNPLLSPAKFTPITDAITGEKIYVNKYSVQEIIPIKMLCEDTYRDSSVLVAPVFGGSSEQQKGKNMACILKEKYSNIEAVVMVTSFIQPNQLVRPITTIYSSDSAVDIVRLLESKE